MSDAPTTLAPGAGTAAGPDHPLADVLPEILDVVAIEFRDIAEDQHWSEAGRTTVVSHRNAHTVCPKGARPERSAVMPTNNFRRRHDLQLRLAAVASDRPSNVLDTPIELYRASGKSTLIHAAQKRCRVTGRKHYGVAYHATIHDLVADPKLCDCATSTSLLGAAGAYLDAIRALDDIGELTARLEAEPGPHRWNLWVRANNAAEQITATTARFEIDELDDELAELAVHLGHLDTTIVDAWRADRHSPAGYLWWRAQTQRHRNWPRNVFYEEVCLGRTPTEMAEAGMLTGLDTAGLWDELHRCDDTADVPVTVVMVNLRAGTARSVALAQWAIAHTDLGYEAVLHCPQWLLGVLDGELVATIDTPVDGTAARLILELAGPAYCDTDVAQAIDAAKLVAT